MKIEIALISSITVEERQNMIVCALAIMAWYPSFEACL